jgi:WD40 repeat protein
MFWRAVRGRFRTVFFQHDCGKRAIRGTEVYARPYPGWTPAVRLFDPTTGECTCTISKGNVHPYVRPIALDGDGRWLAAGGSAPVVLLWDAITGKRLAELSGHSASVEAVALSRDGRWLASGGDDDTAKLWRREDH